MDSNVLIIIRVPMSFDFENKLARDEFTYLIEIC